MRSYRAYVDEKRDDPGHWSEEPEYALIEAMIKSRLSAKELAKKTGLSESFIERLQRAEANPSLSALKRLAAAAGAKLKLEFVPIRGPQSGEGREQAMPSVKKGITHSELYLFCLVLIGAAALFLRLRKNK